MESRISPVILGLAGVSDRRLPGGREHATRIRLLSTSVFAPRALIARLKADPVLRNNAIYLTGSVLAGFLGYVFHFETGHLLGPGSYAVVASAIAALYLLTLPVIGLQLVSARYTSLAAAKGQQQAVLPMLLRITGFSLLVAVPAAALLIVFAPQAAGFLNISDTRVMYVLAFGAIATLVVTINRGALQGLRRFVALSVNVVIDLTSRLAIAAAVITAGFGALGAVGAIMFGPAFAYAQSFIFLRRASGAPGAPDQSEGIGRYTVMATVASVGVQYLFSIDTLLAKHFLAAEAAGLYAAASVLARVVYFLGLSVTNVMFPEVATLHARNERHFHVVDLSLGLVAAVGLPLIVVYGLLPGLVLLPYGSGFDSARPYLGFFALALTMLAIANLLINYFLSIARATFVVPLFAVCALETVLVGLFHSGIWQILTDVLASLGVLTGVMAVMYAADRLGWRKSAP
jgi:O-antigen/teichoic acid export membrane protein